MKTCGALVLIAGLSHLGPFRCTREQGHEAEGSAHSITLGASLLRRVKG